MDDTPQITSRTEFDVDPPERTRLRIVEATDADTGLSVEVSHVAGQDSSGDWHLSVPENLSQLQLLHLPQLIQAALEKARRLRWLRY